MSQEHIPKDGLFYCGHAASSSKKPSFAESSRRYAFPVCELCARYEGTLDMKIHGQRYVACRLAVDGASRARMCSGRGGGKVECAFFLPRTRQIDGHAVIRKK